jgi:hypothetical protein
VRARHGVVVRPRCVILARDLRPDRTTCSRHQLPTLTNGWLRPLPTLVPHGTFAVERASPPRAPPPRCERARRTCLARLHVARCSTAAPSHVDRARPPRARRSDRPHPRLASCDLTVRSFVELFGARTVQLA